MDSVLKAKHERNAAKALTRSKRNSPAPDRPKLLSIQNAKLHRKQRRVVKRALLQTPEKMTSVGSAITGLGKSARGATAPLRAFAKANHATMNQMTVAQLRGMAGDLDVKTTTKMTKAQIIEAIESR